MTQALFLNGKDGWTGALLNTSRNLVACLIVWAKSASDCSLRIRLSSIWRSFIRLLSSSSRAISIARKPSIEASHKYITSSSEKYGSSLSAMARPFLTPGKVDLLRVVGTRNSTE